MAGEKKREPLHTAVYTVYTIIHYSLYNVVYARAHALLSYAFFQSSRWKKCSQKLGPIPQQLLTDIQEELNDKKRKSLAEKRKSTAERALSPSGKQLKITDQSIGDSQIVTRRLCCCSLYILKWSSFSSCR